MPSGTTETVDQNTNRVDIQGTRADVDACVRLVEALDAGQPAPGGATRIMTLDSASPEAIRRAIGAIKSGIAPTSQGRRDPSGRMVSMLFPQFLVLEVQGFSKMQTAVEEGIAVVLQLLNQMEQRRALRVVEEVIDEGGVRVEGA